MANSYLDKLNLLDEYLDVLRGVFSAKAMKDEKPNEDSSQKIKRLLKLSSVDDFKFLLAALDVINDTCLAIENFDRFGLSGATKYDDLGEMYLRLYGMLNAVYLQKDAVLVVCNKLYAENYKVIQKKINSLKIIEVRHKIGAHSVGYHSGSSVECYTPVRISISDKILEFYNMDPSSSEFESIDLSVLLDDYLKCVFLIMRETIQSFVKRIFKDNPDKRNELMETMDILYKREKGEVLLINSNKPILINFVKT